jgi:hypothetical protein
LKVENELLSFQQLLKASENILELFPSGFKLFLKGGA